MAGFEKEIEDWRFIQRLIPQRPPIVMVDRLIYFEQNFVRGGLTVSSDNIFVHQDTLTAPGLIEHMAQVVALYTGYQYFLKDQEAPVGYIGAIKKVDIETLPKVGDSLVTTVEVLHDIMGVTLVTAKTELEGEEIASGEMKTVLAS